jgi:hypothetical protein
MEGALHRLKSKFFCGESNAFQKNVCPGDKMLEFFSLWNKIGIANHHLKL